MDAKLRSGRVAGTSPLPTEPVTHLANDPKGMTTTGKKYIYEKSDDDEVELWKTESFRVGDGRGLECGWNRVNGVWSEKMRDGWWPLRVYELIMWVEVRWLVCTSKKNIVRAYGYVCWRLERWISVSVSCLQGLDLLILGGHSGAKSTLITTSSWLPSNSTAPSCFLF